MKQYVPDYRVTKALGLLVEQISKHWRLVDAVLPQSNPLVVLDDVNLEAFFALPAGKSERLQAVWRMIQRARIAFGALRIGKRALHKRMNSFRQLMMSYWQATPLFSALPLLPEVKAGADEFLGPMRGAMLVWEDVVASPPPVPGQNGALVDGYSAADFAAELAGVESLWRAFYRAEQRVAIARGELLIFYRHAAAAVAAYGHGARSRLAPGHELLASIPRLWRKKKVGKG